ncbi:ATP-binding cassette domain-containing protein [Arthrobacter sp. UM1]|uniref:ATP-binding cassette domain-containing protein n=1 Tax=Arthrobacter sp. UM1 TaxID=2766776 RepID=UPI001CF71933|nr:ATP-binding cassette domain-containing protein [Arthrobacter sp. UM1]MCB4208964.1 ATP-binding cassette domain-containing protein [Arthrobacter sp. UM1]
MRTVSDLAALVPALRGERRGIAWTLAVSLASSLALAALAVVTAHIVATAVLERRLDGPAWIAALPALVLLRALLTWHEMDVSHSIAYRVLAVLRMSLFDGFARGVPSRAGVHTGRLAGTAMRDIEKLEFFYAHTVAQIGSALIIAGAALPAAFAADLRLGLVCAGSLAAVVLVSWLAGRTSHRLGEQRQEAAAGLSERVLDVLAGTREVLVFGQAEQARRTVLGAAAESDALDARLRRWQQLGDDLRDAVAGLTVVGVLLVAFRVEGLPAVWAPCLATGALAVLAPLSQAVAVTAQVQPLRASARRVAEGQRLASEGVPEGVSEAGEGAAATTTPSASAPAGPVGLEAVGVGFSYDGRTPVPLPDLLLRPGEKAALSAPSGSGKSTLAHLATGLWAPDDGAVRLLLPDGSAASPTGMPAGERARLVQLVEQEAGLLHGTLAENLRLARPEATDAMLEDALRAAGLPLPLQTQTGEGGGSLSGGQRARAALARALLLEPGLLVLDETTAALDRRTEDDLLETVLALDCTVLAISHRESTVARFPRRIRWPART